MTEESPNLSCITHAHVLIYTHMNVSTHNFISGSVQDNQGPLFNYSEQRPKFRERLEKLLFFSCFTTVTTAMGRECSESNSTSKNFLPK